MSALSMSIQLKFGGDCDRLPHKDLAEHIIREINDAVKAAMEKAGIGDQFAAVTGTSVHHEAKSRSLLGSDPYGEIYRYVTGEAFWGVHLPDPIPDPVAEAPVVAES